MTIFRAVGLKYVSVVAFIVLTLACGGSSGSSSTPTPPVEAASSTGDSSEGVSNLTQEHGGVETVGMDSSLQLGVGGYFYSVPTPVILFKDGTLCDDINFFTRNISAAEHQAKNPDSWTQWRMQNGVRELLESDGQWNEITYTQVYPALPRGTTLARVYSKTGGGGNIATGGSTIIATVSRFEFRSDGRFIQGKFVGASTDDTTLSSTPPDQQGSYSIEGYRLTLRYDDGTQVVRSLVVDLNDTEIVWIDGDGFLSEDRE